jgi:hypothetical protein
MGSRVNGGRLCAFEDVAPEAAQRQISGGGRNDVVNCVDAPAEVLWRQAILAAITRTGAKTLLLPWGHGISHIAFARSTVSLPYSRKSRIISRRSFSVKVPS